MSLTQEQFEALVDHYATSRVIADVYGDEYTRPEYPNKRVFDILGVDAGTVEAILDWARHVAERVTPVIEAMRNEAYRDRREMQAHDAWELREGLLAGTPGRYLVWHVEPEGDDGSQTWFCEDGSLDEKFSSRHYVVQPDGDGYFPTLEAAIYAADLSIQTSYGRYPAVTEGRVSWKVRMSNWHKIKDWTTAPVVYVGSGRGVESDG